MTAERVQTHLVLFGPIVVLCHIYPGDTVRNGLDCRCLCAHGHLDPRIGLLVGEQDSLENLDQDDRLELDHHSCRLRDQSVWCRSRHA
jgi:hypothetical protein